MDSTPQEQHGDVEWSYMDEYTETLRELRHLYENHDYAAVVRGCNGVLENNPRNRSAKKLKRMAKRRIHQSDLKMGVAMLCISLLMTVGALSFMNKKIVHELQEKDFQITSLIDEVGELKQENLVLNAKLGDHSEALGLVREAVLDIDTRMDRVDVSGGIFDLQVQLEEANKKIETQEEAVNTLLEAGLDYPIDDASDIGEDDTFDVLILGTHGRLTDTIMLASVNPDLETVSLFSIPRDLAVDGRRINEYYYRYGIDPMRSKVKEITGLYPERYVVFDLAAFEDVVDILGGIDVYVEKDLYDTMYPGPNYTYQTFSIEKGMHHMDGKLALMYARSRKSTTDFDRATRQQIVIEAVRNKVEDLGLLKNADELVEMYTTITASVDTDVDLISFLSYLKKYSDYEIERGNVFSTSNYLYSTYGVTGAYLLLPRSGDFEEIQAYVAEVVTK